MDFQISGNVYARVQVLVQQRRYALALHELQQLLATYPDNSVLHGYLGLCLLKSDKLPEAKAATRQAITLDPESDYNYRLLGLILEKERKLPEAEDAARRSIILNSDHVFGYSLLSRILFNQNRLEEAMEVVENGLKLDPEDVECLNVQARILSRLGQADKARLNFENSLKQDPENFYTHTNTGISLAEAGKFDEAIDHFKEAIRLNPEYDLAKRYLLGTYKSRFAFYRFVSNFALDLQDKANPVKSSLNLAMLGGAVFLLRSAPALLPFYLILFHFSLYNEVLFNFQVSFNPEAKRLLLKEEKRRYRFLGGYFLVVFAALLCSKLFDIYVLKNLGLVLTGLSISIVCLFYIADKDSQKNMVNFITNLIFWGLICIVLSYFFPEGNPHGGISEAALYLFYIALIAFCFFRKKL